MTFTTLDYVIFSIYCSIIIGVGLWVSREREGHKKDTADYFLASKSLPFWAIGASLIASNISAEQFIGMSGSGFRIGLAIASYEWMAAVTLLVIAWFFLPIYLQKGIFTMPQFLEQRYDTRVRTLLAVFWLFVYVFVNLASVLYLGALAIEGIMGVPLVWGIVGMAIFATIYSIYGGLKAVAWTDVIQVVVLIGGGLLTTYFALDAFSGGEGAIAGFSQLLTEAGDRFNVILFRGELMYETDTGEIADAWDLLPGMAVLFGGMWVANLFYWGCNQYIIQRALAAKDLREAQRGLAFAAFIKLLLPLVVVIPGIVTYALDAPITRGDEAYPWLLGQFLGSGVRGLAFAALVAAVVSSLASMMNSTATIFTMDLYRNMFKTDASEQHLVSVGRVVTLVAIILGVLVAPQLANLDQAFQYIQEYTGFISPGVLAIFVLGLFWKKATPNAALTSAILSIPLSIGMKVLTPGLPFMHRMMAVFVISILLIVVISYLEGKGKDHPRGIDLSSIKLVKDPVYNIAAFAILAITAVLYALFW